jgi:multidrug efflux pump subunit AcrB
MLAMGWNLERISLGSLIIALGLLVDDSIIAIEMMVVKMEAGWTARRRPPSPTRPPRCRA